MSPKYSEKETLLPNIIAEANEDLVSTLKKMIEKISSEFASSIGDVFIEVDNDSIWTLHPEWRGLHYMGRYDYIKSFNNICKNTTEDINENNVLDVLEDTIVYFIANRNCAIKYIKKRNPDYASAMNHAFRMAKAQGCIAASRNLAVAENYFREFCQGAIKKATLESNDYKKLSSIFIDLAKKKLDSSKTMTEVLNRIAHEFHSKWIDEYKEFPPNWNPDNFPRHINLMRKRNQDFALAYEDIKVKLREINTKKRLAEKKREREMKKKARI